MRDPVVTVVIPTRSKADLVEKALDALFASTALPLEVVIVEQGGSESKHLADGKYRGKVIWCDAPEAASFSKMNNIAVEMTECSPPGSEPPPYILCLNNDAFLDPQCLDRLVDTLEREPETAIVAPGAGKVSAILVAAGDAVRENQTLVDLA